MSGDDCWDDGSPVTEEQLALGNQWALRINAALLAREARQRSAEAAYQREIRAWFAEVLNG